VRVHGKAQQLRRRPNLDWMTVEVPRGDDKPESKPPVIKLLCYVLSRKRHLLFALYLLHEDRGR
jgi:hypothetical protein